MNAKLLRIIGSLNLILILVLFNQLYLSYLGNMLIGLNQDIEDPNSTNFEAYTILMPIYIFFIICLTLIAISSIFSFFLSLNYVIISESIGLSILITVMILPIFFLPFEIVSFVRDEIIYSFIIPILLIGIVIFLIIFKITPHYKKQVVVRKLVLSFSTKYPDFKLYKLAILCSVDKDFVKSVVNDMISKSEIYAEYFKSTKKFAFNIKANIEEIDKLMELYSNWESEHIGKQI